MLFQKIKIKLTLEGDRNIQYSFKPIKKIKFINFDQNCLKKAISTMLLTF